MNEITAPERSPSHQLQPLMSPKVMQLIAAAEQEARKRGHGAVTVEHVLLALVKMSDTKAQQWVAQLGRRAFGDPLDAMLYIRLETFLHTEMAEPVGRVIEGTAVSASHLEEPR